MHAYLTGCLRILVALRCAVPATVVMLVFRGHAEGAFAMQPLYLIMRLALTLPTLHCLLRCAGLLRQPVLDDVEAAHVRVHGPQPGAQGGRRVPERLPPGELMDVWLA